MWTGTWAGIDGSITAYRLSRRERVIDWFSNGAVLVLLSSSSRRRESVVNLDSCVFALAGPGTVLDRNSRPELRFRVVGVDGSIPCLLLTAAGRQLLCMSAFFDEGPPMCASLPGTAVSRPMPNLSLYHFGMS